MWTRGGDPIWTTRRPLRPESTWPMPADFTLDDGLSEVQARQRLAQDGPNELPASRPRGVLRLFRDVVSEPMFLLLVACGAIYMVLGDRNEALMLLGFVFVVMGITFVQQRRTERSLEALRCLLYTSDAADE